MNLGLLVAFWGMVVLLIVVPGPDWAFTLASGLRDRTVFPAVGGLVVGYMILTVFITAGIGVLVARYPLVLTVITVGGAGYLAYLGITMLIRPGGLHAPAAGERTSTSGWARLLNGVGVSALNPKGLVIFIALLPQFTDPAAGWPFTAQVLTLGLLFAISCGIFYTVLGVSSRAVLSSRPGISRLISRISGVAMILVGLGLLVEHIVAGNAH